MEHRTPEQVSSPEFETDYTKARRAHEIAETAAEAIEESANSHPEAKDMLLELGDKVAAQVFKEICDMLKIDESIRRETIAPGEQSRD